MNPFNYSIEIKLCDAQMVFGQKLDDESEEEYSARYKEAEGKFFLRAVLRDNVGSPSYISVQSPYFDYDTHNPAMPPMCIMHALTALLVQREIEK